MRCVTLLTVYCALLTCRGVWGDQWAPGMFGPQSHDFGTIAAGAKAQFSFVVTNNYAREVHIASARSSCGCSDVRIEKPTLQTYETGAIVASINSRRLRGRQGATITVVFDRPAYAEVQLRVDVFIRGDVVLSPPSVEFGELPLGKPAEKQLTVTRYGNRDWKLLEVAGGHPNVSASFEEIARTEQEVSYRLNVRLNGQASDGFLNEAVMLTTTDGDPTRIPVMVQGKILPKIAVAPHDVFLGVVAPGETATRQIVVRSDEPFQITAITADCECFEFTLPETAASKKLYVVPLKFKAAGKERGIKKVIAVQTDTGYTAQLVAHAAVRID